MKRGVISVLTSLAAITFAAGCSPPLDYSPAVCSRYVACFEMTGGTKGSLDTTYGPMGSCWTTTDAAAEACEVACKTALPSLREEYPDAGCGDNK